MSQTSTSEKQLTADEKVSEEGVRFHSSPSLSSFRSPDGDYSSYESRKHHDPPHPLPIHQQRGRMISQSSVWRSKDQGETVEKRDPVLPTTTVQCDPDEEQYNHSLPAEPRDEMSGGGYFARGHSSARSAYQHYSKIKSEHGSPWFPNLSPFINPSTPSVFSGRYDEDSFKRAGYTPQAETEEFDEMTSLIKNQESQTSISENQLTADEKVSEEGVRDKLPSESLSSLSPHYSSLSLSSFRSPDGDYSLYESRKHHDPPHLLPIHQQRGRIIIQSSFWRSKDQGETVEKRDPVLPTTTVQCDPDEEQYNHSLPVEPRDEMSGGGYFACGRSSACSAYQHYSKTKSEHGSPWFPNLSPFINPSTPSVFSGRYDEDSFKRAGYTPQAETEEFDEMTSLINYQESQTSISENQLTADEKVSEEGVRDKLPSKSLSSLSRRRTSPSLSSFRSPDDDYSLYQSRKHHDPPHLLPIRQQRGRKICRGSVWSSKDQGETVEKRDPVLPTTTDRRVRLTSKSEITDNLLYYNPPCKKLRVTETQSMAITSPVLTFTQDGSSCEAKAFLDSTYVIDCMSDLSGTLTETGVIEKHSSAADVTPGVSQDNTREMEQYVTAGPFTFQASTNKNDEYEGACFTSAPSPPSDEILNLLNRKDTDNGGPSFDNSSSTFSIPTRWQSIAPPVADPPCPQGRQTVLQASTVSTKGGGVQDAFEQLSGQSKSEARGDTDVPIEMEASVTALKYSVTSTLPTHSHRRIVPLDAGQSKRGSSCLPRSHSMPSLSQVASATIKTFTRANSLPDILLKDSFEKFTPDITGDENEETYRFQCSCPGLYQCSVTGLVFHMEGEGDVVYRMVPWNRRLLAQNHKQPAGPLFDIKCLQQSVCQLYLPHCEICSTGGGEFLSVAHVDDDGVEFITPHKVTETHVIINITRFSGFGNVKDEDSPPDPVRALVLLFYRPPADPDLESLLNVLLLPRNAVLRDVLRTRKKLVGDERYLETSPHCKLHPKQKYTLSTCPEDDSVLIQPTEAEFECDNYEDYYPSYQVNLEKIMKHIKLFLKDTSSSHCVWERRVCLLSTGVKRSCGQSALNLPPHERLMAVRSSFIDGISGPVLKSLLDKLFEKTVLTESERESADEVPNKTDKARFVIDTVRKKGETASLEMIEFLCEIDPFLCDHLGLI